MRKELDLGLKKRIALYGTEKEIRDTEKVILTLKLTGNEPEDRLLLQDTIDEFKLKADILYDGNTIIPYKKTIREFNKYNKQKTLDNLSNYFYKFLHLNCGDIAHYNKYGYIDYYNNDFNEVKRHVIDMATAPSWKTDLIRVFDKIKCK